MTATLVETAALPTEVTEYERITCEGCSKTSPFLDDGDDGTHEAQDAGWHVLYNSQCGCPNLCKDCAEERCGRADDSPRLFGMRVV
ncbi:hypothetical protein ACIG3E_32650 [Streptomyces sp. NPDC053474]|uniref:hypothetical protein n=1 Tax=Streptomyces sp. NPDC053474 TaxID=3365704 RepID=UPI0037D2BDA0